MTSEKKMVEAGVGEESPASSSVDERERRLLALKRSIDSGQYRIASGLLADCLLRRMRETRPPAVDIS